MVFLYFLLSQHGPSGYPEGTQIPLLETSYLVKSLLHSVDWPVEILVHLPVWSSSKTSIKFFLLSLNCTKGLFVESQKLVHLSTLTRELFFCSRWRSIQRSTTRLQSDNVRLWRAQLSKVWLHLTLSLQDSRVIMEERKKQLLRVKWSRGLQWNSGYDYMYRTCTWSSHSKA